MAKTKPVLPLLEAGPVPLAQLRAAAKKQLVDIVDSKRGKKALILDPAISGSLQQLDSGLSELFTEHGIVKLLYLERTRLDDTTYNSSEPRLSDIRPIIYIARATLENAQLIAWQIKNSRVASSSSSRYVQTGWWLIKHQHQASAYLTAAVTGAVESAAMHVMPHSAIRSASANLPSCPPVQLLLCRSAAASGAANVHEYSVFWVPRHSIAVQKVLEEEGVYGDVQQGEFCLDVIPLDDDVLSLELSCAYRDCVLDGDTAPLFYTACALLKLQEVYGLIPRLQGKGPAAAAVKDITIKLRKESPLPAAAAATCRIHRAIILDRDIDVITPLITQITFEGLIDEITGIRHGSVSYTPSKREGGGGGAPGRPATVFLNSSDPFYKEFRDLPYYITSQRLQQYARDARKEYTELGSKDLSELKTFVKGLPKLLLLDRLSDLAVPVAEVVKEQSFHDRLKTEQDILEGYDVEEAVQYVQGLMWRGADLLVVLRLLCLISGACGGLPKKHADSLRNEFLAAYGHQHLLTLNHLERAGLLRPQSPNIRNTFPSIRKALKLLVPDDGSELHSAPADISHLYKGYAPLSIRLVEHALQGGWGQIAEALSYLPGAQFDSLQVLDPSGQVVDKPFKPAPGTAGAAGSEAETVLLVMLGGITFTEISALRLLSSRPECNCRFLVLTTGIINGTTLLKSFVDAPAANVRAA
eukprot:GHUV01006338.1.p1 GENE.GHUV01006338.1~~GHUV01006338.1.p1  ORF type:complete len:699 (+),score=233.80 GHUV01006338.1:290-2386(+)